MACLRARDEMRWGIKSLLDKIMAQPKPDARAEEEYTLELTREEIDALIKYLKHSPNLVEDDKTNLIVAKMLDRLTKMRARTHLAVMCTMQ